MKRYRDFFELVTEVKACRKCRRMDSSARVLNGSSGAVYSDLMFVGEAPGRRGADETEIPFHGDVAGNNFEGFLDHVGLSRSDIYISNAALCNPRDDKGNNSTPNKQELSNCSDYLRRQIDLVNPKIIVTLGGIALSAISNIERHSLTLRDHVRTSNSWNGRQLIPLYHPGQRAMIHRSKANQRADYQFVAEQWRRLDKSRKKISHRPVQQDILTLCKHLLSSFGEISYFELHKLVYLTEYLYVSDNGERLTRSYFIRQKDGPYCTDLQISRLKKALPELQVTKRGGDLFFSISPHQELSLDNSNMGLDDSIEAAVIRVRNRYSYNSNSDLKKIVYLTAPMRVILRRESRDRQNLFNAPIDFLVGSSV